MNNNDDDDNGDSGGGKQPPIPPLPTIYPPEPNKIDGWTIVKHQKPVWLDTGRGVGFYSFYHQWSTTGYCSALLGQGIYIYMSVCVWVCHKKNVTQAK